MKTRFLKIITIPLIMLFTAQSVCFASPSVYTITVPEGEGKVVHRWQAKNSQKPEDRRQNTENRRQKSEKALSSDNSKMVILIQDAHANTDAQIRLGNIVASLVPQIQKTEDRRQRTEKAPFVGVEGAFGEYDLKSLRDCPIKEVREIVGRDFVRSGKFIGAEYASIIADNDFTLYGLEERDAFIENFKAFYTVSDEQEEVENTLNEIEALLALLKDTVYNESLREFDRTAHTYEKGTIDFIAYLPTILKEVDSFNIDLAEYIYLFQCREIFTLRQAVDEAKLDEEMEKLTGIIVNTTNDQPPRTHDTKEIVNWLSVLAQKLDIPLDNYPNVVLIREYWHQYALLDMAMMLQEVLVLNHTIRLNRAQIDDEKRLIVLADRLMKIRTLLSLAALPDEVELFRAMRETYRLSTIVENLEELAKRYASLSGSEIKTDEVNKIDKLLDTIDDFYRLAEKRDAILVDNLLQKMDDTGQTIGVLVAGGYHAPGIVHLLRKRNISYITVMPKVESVGNDTVYKNRMAGNIAPLDPVFLEGTAPFSQKMPEKGAVPLSFSHITASFEGLNPAEFQNFLNEAGLHLSGQLLLDEKGQLLSPEEIVQRINTIRQQYSDSAEYARKADALERIVKELDTIVAKVLREDGDIHDHAERIMEVFGKVLNADENESFRKNIGQTVADEENRQAYLQKAKKRFFALLGIVEADKTRLPADEAEIKTRMDADEQKLPDTSTNATASSESTEKQAHRTPQGSPKAEGASGVISCIDRDKIMMLWKERMGKTGDEILIEKIYGIFNDYDIDKNLKIPEDIDDI
ncbi:MAG: hypothetical protein ABIH47_00320 [Candidatus Omnitrophota bacterium]